MLTSPLHGDLEVTSTEQRVELAFIDRQRRHGDLLTSSDFFARRHAHIKLLRLPRAQAFFDLLRKTRRVGSVAIVFGRENPSGLMMAVPVCRCARPGRDNHKWPKGTNDAHHI